MTGAFHVLERSWSSVGSTTANKSNYFKQYPLSFRWKSFTQMCGEADWACAITEIHDTADGVVTVHVWEPLSKSGARGGGDRPETLYY